MSSPYSNFNLPLLAELLRQGAFKMNPFAGGELPTAPTAAPVSPPAPEPSLGTQLGLPPGVDPNSLVSQPWPGAQQGAPSPQTGQTPAPQGKMPLLARIGQMLAMTGAGMRDPSLVGRMALEQQAFTAQQQESSERKRMEQLRLDMEKRRLDLDERQENMKINKIAFDAADREVGKDSANFGEVFMRKLKGLQDLSKDSTILGPVQMQGGKVGVYIMGPDNKPTAVELPGALPEKPDTTQEERDVQDYMISKGWPNDAEHRVMARNELKTPPEQRQAILDYIERKGWPNDATHRDMARVATQERKQAININLGNTIPIQGDTPQDRLAKIPASERAIVQSIVEYRIPLPSGFALRSPQWMKILNYATQVDPTFNAMNYPVRQQMVRAYTTGQQAKEINAINTVMGHTAVLADAVDALENKNIPLLNQIANYYKVNIGESPITTFRAIVNRVGPEVTKAYVGTGGEFAERKENEADFNPNYSPAQLKTNIHITARLLRSKIGSLENQWIQTMGTPNFEERFITPEANAALEKLSPQSVGGYKGKTTTAPVKAGIETFEQRKKRLGLK